MCLELIFRSLFIPGGVTSPVFCHPDETRGKKTCSAYTTRGVIIVFFFFFLPPFLSIAACQSAKRGLSSPPLLFSALTGSN